MTRRGGKENPDQYGRQYAFVVDSTVNRIVPKELATNIPVIGALVARVENRPLWVSRPRPNKDAGAIVDLTGAQKETDYFADSKAIVFNTMTDEIAGVLPYKRLAVIYCGLIVVVSDIYKLRGGVFDDLLARVRDVGPVFLAARESEVADTDVIRAFGARRLAQVAALSVGVDGFKIYEARKRKKGKHTERDYTTDAHPKMQRAIQGALATLTRTYRELGIELVNPQESEAMLRLRNSKNPIGDLRNLQMGFGLEYLRSCGCHTKISINGTETTIRSCGHPHVDQQLPHKMSEAKGKVKTTEIPGYSRHREFDSLRCFDCGELAVREERLIKRSVTFEEVLVDYHCPCGSTSETFTEKRKVSTFLD